MSLAKVTLIGNLGRDPETRATPSGATNVTFSVATSRTYNGQETTTWWRVTAWGRLAETLVSLQQQGALGKGRQVYVEGRVEAREYQDRAGATKTSLDITANEVQLLGPRGASDDAGTGNEYQGVGF